MTERVASPCISVCALDKDDVCMGCSRTGQEIMNWGKMSNDERREVLKKVAERESLLYINAGNTPSN